MKTVLLSGASGLIGQQLTEKLLVDGCRVRILKRPTSKPRDMGDVELLTWNPYENDMPLDGIRDVDAVIHLGGANIAERRWTKARKTVLRDSRIKTTAVIANALAQIPKPPSVFICASAIGFYGDRGKEQLTESSSTGVGFLSELCADWEAACEPASAAGIRVVQARFGVVLDPQGGALAKMKGPFSLGLGGVAGSGNQMMSWISLGDAVRAIRFCITEATLEGPVNLVHPQAVDNREFSKTLARVLRRPAMMPLPRFAARLVMGEMANSLLFDSCHAVPDKLLKAGFRFEDTNLEETLKKLLY